MPCCLKCGREIEVGLELFCPRCLGNAEKNELSRKGLSSLFSQYHVMIYLGITVILFLGAVFWRQAAPASSQITVPGSFPTIQAGINAAGAGNTVVLKPGVYYENIDFMGTAITLRSTRPKDPAVVASTVIQGNGKGSTVSFKSGETGETVLQGLTISGGVAEIKESSTASHPVVDSGGVIFIDAGSTPLIRDNLITSGTALQGGAVYINNASPSIINNTIMNNQAHWQGGALYISDGAKPVIKDNIIASNSAEDGGGIYVLHAVPLITDNRISENNALYQGGGMMLQGGTPEISSNIFELNRAGECGGAAALFKTSPLLRDNYFSNNVGGWRGGGALYVGLKSTPQLSGNTFTQNSATQGKDIWVSADSSLKALKGVDVYYQD